MNGSMFEQPGNSYRVLDGRNIKAECHEIREGSSQQRPCHALGAGQFTQVTTGEVARRIMCEEMTGDANNWGRIEIVGLAGRALRPV